MSDRYDMSETSPAGVEDEATPGLSTHDLASEGGELLPDKEVLSVLDLFVNIDLAHDLAAPIDLAVAANANVAAPIDASASANVLSFGSTSGALAHQATLIDQHISGEAIATAPQDATLDQSNDVVDGGDTSGSAGTTGDGGTDTSSTDTGGDSGSDTSGATSQAVQPAADQGSNVSSGGATTQVTEGTDGNDLLEGPLLNVNVDASIDADLAAPVAGAVAANANVAAPIDAAVSANIGTIASQSTAIADQTAVIHQDLEDVTASATADQEADITQ